MFEQLLEDVRRFHQPQVDKPEETPETILRALWFTAAGTPASVGRARGALPDIDEFQVALLENLIARKREGVPLGHLTGRQEFLGLELLAEASALIPRKETEILGCAVLGELRRRAVDAESILAIDVCTGSGNLALGYAAHERKARVFAADISEEAVALARRNAQFTGLADRVFFETGDLFAPFAERADLVGHCDLVSCNPPYISTAKVQKMAPEISTHEPRLAFDGGALGITILTRLFEEAPPFLKPGGALCFEVGVGQGVRLESRLRRLPWVETIEAHKDDNGAIRALVATRWLT